MTNKKVTLSKNYRWANPDLARLAEVVKNLILPYLGDDFYFNGTIIEEEDVVIESKLSFIDELPNYKDLVYTEFWLSFSSNANDRDFRIRFYRTDGSTTVTMKLDPSGLETARGILSEFEKSLNLATDDRRETVNLVKVDRRYDFRKPDTHDTFIEITNWLNEILSAEIDRVEGDFEIAGSRYSQNTYPQWVDELSRNWEDIDEATIRFQNRDIYVRTQLLPENDELVVAIEKPSQEDILSLLGDLESKFMLQVLENRQRQRIGETRQYFTNQPLDQSWLDNAIQIILSTVSEQARFYGRYRLIETPTQEAIRENSNVWLAEVERNWSHLLNAYLEFSSNRKRIQLSIEPHRDWISITVFELSKEACISSHEFLVGQLGLELITEFAYGTPKTTESYYYEGWVNSNFAQATRTAIKRFVNEEFRLYVVEAYIDYGPESRGRKDFTDLEEFLTYAGDDTKPYTDARIFVEGPRGRALAVNVKGDEHKLEIYTDIEAEKYHQLEKMFTDKIGLENVKVDKAEVKEVTKKTSLWLEVAKLLVPALIGFVLSSVFWANLFPKHTLEITVPRSVGEQGMPVVISSAQVPVEWVLQTEQWFQTKIDRQSLAQIRVLKDGLVVIENLANQTPDNVALELQPGIYDIEVISNLANVSDKVRVSIQVEE